MVDVVKLLSLTPITSLDGTEIIYLERVAAGVGSERRISIADMFAGAPAVTILDVTTTFKRNGVDKTAALDAAILAATATAKAYGVKLSEMRKAAAVKDALPDAPDGTNLGHGDAAGSVLTGGQTNNTAISETCAFDFVLPAEYVAAAALTLRVRCKVSATRFLNQRIDAVAKLLGDSLGADICATAVQAITTSYADYDFVITPATLVAGKVLHVELTLSTDDTGGSTNGTPTISAVSLRPTVLT